MAEKSIWSAAPTKRRVSFDSPEEMWNVAVQYFEWCDTNPLYKTEQLKSPERAPIEVTPGVHVPAEKVIDMPLKRAYSKVGFCVFAGIGDNYLRRMKLHSAGNTGADNDAWIDILNRIENVIFNQQYEGAAAGQLNANIVARGLGLTDKIDATNRNFDSEVKETFKIGEQEFEL
jgi:hypothetical protein